DVVDVPAQVELGPERQQHLQCEARAQHLQRPRLVPGRRAVVALARRAAVRDRLAGGARLHWLDAPAVRPFEFTRGASRRARSPSRRVGWRAAQATAAGPPKISTRDLARVMPV